MNYYPHFFYRKKKDVTFSLMLVPPYNPVAWKYPKEVKAIQMNGLEMKIFEYQ